MPIKHPKSKTKICKTCQKKFESLPIIDGKQIRLTTRTSCLSCFPRRIKIPKYAKYEQGIKENYPKFGGRWCMEKYNLTRDQISVTVYKYGLRILEESKHLIPVYRKVWGENLYKVNHEQFIDIKTPIVAYILGLLWTDGSINKKSNKISFGTTFPDSEYFFPQFLKTGEWGTTSYQPKNLRYKRAVNIYTSNKFLKEFLVSYNYIDKERGFESIYNHIPEQFRKYFIIGMIDGDGCFHRYKDGSHCVFSMVSSYDQNWDGLTKLLTKLNLYCFIRRYKCKKGASSAVIMQGKTRIVDFGDYLYETHPLDNIGLPRKYDKYLEIKYSPTKRKSKSLLMPTSEVKTIFMYSKEIKLEMEQDKSKCHDFQP